VHAAQPARFISAVTAFLDGSRPGAAPPA
jgi:hypothetical protein